MIKLRPYQEEAADFIYEHDRSLILAKVGAGKTAIALTAMRDMLRDGLVRRWLVVAPVRVCKDTWPTEIEKWAPELSYGIAVGTPQQRVKAIKAETAAVVINYDNLQWLAAHFPNLPDFFDGVVFDELTRLKNASGKRFKAFETAADGIRFRIGLTGSFTSNGLEDTYGQVRIVDRSILGRSKGAFLQTYFWSANPALGEWMPRPGALKAIMDKIKPIAYVLESPEYEASLPPLTLIPMLCEMTDPEPYKRMKKDMVLRFDATTITAVNGGVVVQKLRQLSSGFVYESTAEPDPNKPGEFKLSKTPHWFSHHKFDMLHGILEENHHEPTLLFYQYQEELAELRRRYPYIQTLDDRDAVARWNRGEIELLAAHPDSAQYGLNLQDGGCAIVWLSLPWSLTNFEQANGRLHRSGQRHEVRVYMILAKNTVDLVVLDALQNKKALADIAREALK